MTTLLDSTDLAYVTIGDQALRGRLFLLDEDIRSAQIALCGFRSAQGALASASTADEAQSLRAQMFYHAKGFVCAMRRIERLFSSLLTDLPSLPKDRARAVKMAWRSRRSMMEQYRKPRDVIEHLDDRIRGKVSWVLLNLCNDVFEAMPSVRAEINERNLAAILSAREEVVTALSTGCKRASTDVPAT